MSGGVFIGLGSNLGDREGHIRAALIELEADGGLRVLRCSSLHETEPVGGPPGQPAFLNAVAEVETTLSPQALLRRLQEIETRHGRTRGPAPWGADGRWGPRTLDLDLLLYGERIIDEPDLVVPHPRMWQRAFVLRPLAEVCDENRLVALRRAAGPPARGETGSDAGRAALCPVACRRDTAARFRGPA